jgi:hypothetical protein
MPEDPEDLKLITLARATLARTGAAEGRAYAAASVHLEHLVLSAIGVAVAMAVSSGSGGLEAVALVSEESPTSDDLEIVRDLSGDGLTLWWADPRGTVQLVVEI